jgi:cellulose synthase/poly-beta-1,6-N-acetylglucosamine synthase-like glycosyltransferase
MIYLGSILLFFYIITLVILLIGYQNIKEFKNKKTILKTLFSIIIPFRNEAENLPYLIKTIADLNYPPKLFEIIFVDDDSEDSSIKIITTESTFQNYTIIKNNRKSNSPKKDAITEAISISKFNWIITTDADCVLPKNWLLNFNQFIKENNPNMVAGPVGYKKKKGLINSYQQYDNFSLQTVTIGGFGIKTPLMCNGANLAYRKNVFQDVSGFSGNESVASGDDIFLMEKFKKIDKNGIQFIKNKGSIVLTSGENSWKDIISQRIRWASKTSKQSNIITQLIGLVVFLTNFFILIGIGYFFY